MLKGFFLLKFEFETLMLVIAWVFESEIKSDTNFFKLKFEQLKVKMKT